MRRHKHRPSTSPGSRHGKTARRGPKGGSDRILLYGLHAVEAALVNPKREIHRLLATENAASKLATALAKRGVKVEESTPQALDRLLAADAVHQGVVLETELLPPVALDQVDTGGILVVLDQVTDPQNVGAVLRSAAAFGAAGLILHDRSSPPLGGILAKAASGALDTVPVIQVTNLARALAELGERFVFRVGFAEEATAALETTPLTMPLALVLGAEGRGLRELTRERCDLICRISTKGRLASLNVSNAAAIALHWASTAGQREAR